MNVSFIGCGNMGSAIIKGIIKSGIIKADDIYLSDKNKEQLTELSKKYQTHIADNNIEAVKNANVVFLAIKPNVCSLVINEIKNFIDNNTIVISIVAGLKIEQIEDMFEREVKLIRVMPNTPALVGEGMCGISYNKNIKDKELESIIPIFESFGEAEIVEEKLMDVVTAVSGSSPAYIFMLIEAMADGAVLEGMPRDKAYKFAAQAVLGSAKMVLETNIHPGQLKDQVCSPGGTTIEAVSVLEDKGFRSSIIEAIKKCADKSRKLADK